MTLWNLLGVTFLLGGAFHTFQLSRAVWRLQRDEPTLWERLGRPRHFVVFGHFPRAFRNYLFGRGYEELQPGPVRSALARAFWSLVISITLLLLLAVASLLSG